MLIDDVGRIEIVTPSLVLYELRRILKRGCSAIHIFPTLILAIGPPLDLGRIYELLFMAFLLLLWLQVRALIWKNWIVLSRHWIVSF